VVYATGTQKSIDRITNFALLLLVVLIIVVLYLAFFPPSSRSPNGGDRNWPATLRGIHSAQTLFQEKLILDADGDEKGEFGYLDDLIKARAINLNAINKGKDSLVEKNGYYFKSYLPNSSQGKAGADENEQQYLVLCWPVECDKTGNKAGFISVEGSAYFHINGLTEAMWDGKKRLPSLDDIFEEGHYYDIDYLKEGWGQIK